MSWTQPLCLKCWTAENPDRAPVQLKPLYRTPERCCTCGRKTRAGLYVRRNPATVAYPRVEPAE